MADYRLKVSTEEVRTKAQQISVQRGNLENLLSEFKTKVASLENYWKSDSGVDYGVQFQNVSKNVTGALETLQKHVNNLLDAANSYEQLESTQVKKAQNLSTDNIF